MNIHRRILDLVGPTLGDRNVADVRIGLGYTAVMLDDMTAGVAYTFRDSIAHGCSVFHGSRPLSGKPALDVARFLESSDTIECSVGLAAVNAAISSLPISAITSDVLDAVEFRPDDRVGMVGFFAPLLPALKKKVSSVEIFDEHPNPSQGILPASEAPTRLRECQVALITSTTIINGTIEPILEAAGSCRETVLLGPSTPLLADAFAGSGVTYLSGMVIKDPAGILRVVSEGGGTRFFKPYVDKYNVRV